MKTVFTWQLSAVITCGLFFLGGTLAYGESPAEVLERYHRQMVTQAISNMKKDCERYRGASNISYYMFNCDCLGQQLDSNWRNDQSGWHGTLNLSSCLDSANVMAVQKANCERSKLAGDCDCYAKELAKRAKYYIDSAPPDIRELDFRTLASKVTAAGGGKDGVHGAAAAVCQPN